MIDPPYSIEEALDICLARLSAGESVDTCLRDFPQYADEIEPLLVAAAQLRSWSPPELSTRARTSARTRARVALRRANYQRAAWKRGGWALQLGAAALLVMALVGGGVASASNSLPGSPLYGLKRVGESTRLIFVSDSAERAQLNLDFAQQRVDEMIAVAREGKAVDQQLLADLDNAYQAAAEAITQADAAKQSALLMRYRAQVEAHRAALGQAHDDSPPGAIQQALDAASRASTTADMKLVGLDSPPAPVIETTATPVPTRTATAAATETARPRPRPSSTPEDTATALPSETPTSTVTPLPTTRPPATPRPRPRPTLAPTLEATATAEPTAEPTVEPTVEPIVASTAEPTAEPTHGGGDDEHHDSTPQPTPPNADSQPPETKTPEPKRTDPPSPPASSTPEPRETPKPTEGATPRPQEPTRTTATPEPRASESPEPRASESPEPRASASPEPRASVSPEPRASESPEPRASESPEPEHGPTATHHP